MTPKTALLVMDMQEGILQRYPDAAALTAKVRSAAQHARANGIPVFYITLGLRQGMPDVPESNKIFSGSRQMTGGNIPEGFSAIPEALAPEAADIRITKRRVSAFSGSDLELVLRGMSVTHIILTGISTSGVVLSTLREASDKDYKITVLSDCCGDGDEEVHRVLTTKILPRQADVVTLQEWTGGRL